MEQAQKLVIILDKMTIAAEDYGVVTDLLQKGSPEHRLAKLNLARLQDAVNDLDVYLIELGVFPPA